MRRGQPGVTRRAAGPPGGSPGSPRPVRAAQGPGGRPPSCSMAPRRRAGRQARRRVLPGLAEPVGSSLRVRGQAASAARSARADAACTARVSLARASAGPDAASPHAASAHDGARPAESKTPGRRAQTRRRPSVSEGTAPVVGTTPAQRATPRSTAVATSSQPVRPRRATSRESAHRHRSGRAHPRAGRRRGRGRRWRPPRRPARLDHGLQATDHDGLLDRPQPAEPARGRQRAGQHGGQRRLVELHHDLGTGHEPPHLGDVTPPPRARRRGRGRHRRRRRRARAGAGGGRRRGSTARSPAPERPGVAVGELGRRRGPGAARPCARERSRPGRSTSRQPTGCRSTGMSTSSAAARPIMSAPGPRAGSSGRYGTCGSGSSPSVVRSVSTPSSPGHEPTPLARPGTGSSIPRASARPVAPDKGWRPRWPRRHAPRCRPAPPPSPDGDPFPVALPSGLAARRPDLPADGAGVVELVRAIDAAYVGRPSQPPEQVVADLEESGDLSTDAWLVAAGDRTVGPRLVRRREPASRPGPCSGSTSTRRPISPAPASRRALVDAMLDRARRWPRPGGVEALLVESGCQQADTGTGAALRAAGFSHERTFWRMERPLDPSLTAPEPPPGVTVRQRSRRAGRPHPAPPAVHADVRRALGHRAPSRGRVVAARARRRRLRPDPMVDRRARRRARGPAARRREPVGRRRRLRPYPRRHPGARGRGIGRHLLLVLFAEQARRGWTGRS